MNTQRLKKIYEAKGYKIINLKPGMFIEIHEKVKEGENQRIWKFKGIVIKVRKPGHIDGSFTIRGESAGIKVEKTYPLSFPNFEKIVLLDKYKIRRAKLYYLREKLGKKAMKLKSIISQDERNTFIN